MSPSAIALLGSGEFEPWTEPVDRWLLDRATGDGTVLILPTASAPEGDRVFTMWADMGLAHYGRLGIASEVVPMKTREDADRPEFAGMLERASIVYFSGGNPAYLATVLRESRFWSDLIRRLDQGLAYTGCSAGVACLGESAPDSSKLDPFRRNVWKPGMRLFPQVQLAPHWDVLEAFRPGLRDFIVASLPKDTRLLAIDERTALVGDGVHWTVLGSGMAHLLERGAWTEAGTGEALEAHLLPDVDVKGERTP